MNRKRTPLALLAAALLWLLSGVPSASAMPAGRADATTGSLQANDRHRPQWEDVGLEDLLLTVSQPSVEAPTTARHVHEEAHCEASAPAQHLRPLRCHAMRSVLPHRAVPGYLYLLLCLRI